MKLTDGFGREINYLRLSVTDRCNYRCIYCMAEEMTFLPRAEILSLEESVELCATFAELGVKKIRVTGGEPLIRHNIDTFFQKLSKINALEEITLTTNGSRLKEYAPTLAASGVKRINVSLDSMIPSQFRQITRVGDLDDVLAGIYAAQIAGIERIKLNAVILKNRNLNQVLPLVHYALQNSLDISFIEEMPLGEISEHGRKAEFCCSKEVRDLIRQHFELTPSLISTAGPSRYWQIAGFSSLVGFISPHSENFCGQCNRVRVTAEGRLILCLGNEHSVDLKSVMRRYPGDRQRLKKSIVEAVGKKPEKHHFYGKDTPQVVRFMNATGG